MTTALAHNDFDDALCAGLDWLYHTEQPPQALVERCGARITTTAHRLRFLPIGPDDAPLVVIELKPARWTPSGTQPALHALPRCELSALASTLAERGLDPVCCHHHGDHGAVTLSELAHPSLREAVIRYSRGCPWHHDLVCDAPISAGGQACSWHTEGHDAAIWPSSTACSCRPAAAVYRSEGR